MLDAFVGCAMVRELSRDEPFAGPHLRGWCWDMADYYRGVSDSPHNWAHDSSDAHRRKPND